MFDKDDPLRLEFIDGKRWLLLEDLAYASERLGLTIDVWLGFVTDFASIPRPLWWLWPPAGGPWSKAAVIHDWLYATAYAERPGKVGVDVTRAQADAIFREALGDLGVSWTTRWLMWSGVRTGGAASWKRYRHDEKAGPER